MPGSKEYKMTIRMDASTGGGFNSAFSKAQQELSKMQQEIQRLNSVQGDISAYQKQQAAVEATARKLDVLRQKHDNIQREIQETGTFSSDLANKELTVQQQIDKTEQKMAEQTAKLGEMGSALREAGVDTNNLTGESKRLEAEMQQVQAAQEDVAAAAEQMGDGMVSAMEAASAAIAAAGIAAGLKEIVGAFKECVEVAAQFEATMSTVEALSGANQEEMAALSAQAKELGATTVFSAQQAGDAMTYMGMAGWDAADMLSGMDGVLQLAAASGEDLAMVSDIVTDNLTAFGMKASDTARFADVLAAAATNSNTSVSVMGETFKNSAAIAGALGYSVEDVAVAVGLMANAGIKGSIAGTSLKNTFNGLLEGATLTGEAFGEYNFTALQADGSTKGFKATMDELRGVFDQMTGAEKAHNAQLLAGNRGYVGLMAILNATEEDYTKLTAAINDSSGAAERMSKIKLDNLQGDIALANSAMEAFKTTVGEALIPALREMVQTGTEALTWLNAFTAEHPEAVQAVAALTVGVSAAAVGLAGFAAALKVIKALEMGAIFASGVGPMVLLAGAFAGLATMGIAGADATKANRGEYYHLTAASQKQYREMQALNAEYQQVTATKFQDTEETIALRARVDELTEAYEANKQTLSAWQEENADLISSVQELRDSYNESVEGIHDQSTETQALTHRLEELAGKEKLTLAEQQQMASMVDRLNASIPGLGLRYDKATGSLNKTTEAINRATKAQAQQRYEQEKAEYYVDLYAKQKHLADQVTEEEENLAAAREHLASLEGAQGPGSTQEDRQAYQQALEDARMYEAELSELQGLYDDVTSEVGAYEGHIASAAGDTRTLEDATADLNTALDNLQTAYSDAYTAAKESMEGQFSLWDKVEKVTSTSMDTLLENINSQKEYWANYDQNFATVQKAAEDFGIDISGVMSQLSDLSPEAAAALAGIADEIRNSAEGGHDALQELANEWADLETTMGSAAETLASGSEGVQLAMDQVKQAVQNGASDINIADEFRAAAEADLNEVIAVFGDGSGIASALEGLRSQLSAGVSSLDFKGESTTAGSGISIGLAQGIAQSAHQAITAVTKMGTDTITNAKKSLGESSPSVYMNQAGVDLIIGLVNGINATSPQGVSAMQQAANSAINAFKALSNTSTLYSSGANLLQGAINGINAKIPSLVAAARRAGQAAAQAFKDANQISSPSKLFKYFGQMDIEGAIQGLQSKQEEANKAFAAAATGNVEAYQEAMSDQRASGQVMASLNDQSAAAMPPDGSEAVIIPAMLVETLAAYQQAMRRSAPDQVQAERMERIIEVVRATHIGASADDDGDSGNTTVNISFNISGNPSADIIEQLREFAASDEFRETVVEAVTDAQRDAARRRY